MHRKEIVKRLIKLSRAIKEGTWDGPGIQSIEKTTGQCKKVIEAKGWRVLDTKEWKVPTGTKTVFFVKGKANIDATLSLLSEISGIDSVDYDSSQGMSTFRVIQ